MAASTQTWAEREYGLALLVLTAATGAVDGVSYLALDRVFTGNMTGNVLFVGFGLAGVDDIPVLNNLVALLTFVLGAALGSRLTRRGAGGPVRLPRSSMVVQLVVVLGTFALAGVWLGLGRLGTTEMVVITGVLALLLGAQAAGVRHTQIRDLSTVVVTMTMVNLAADSRLAGGAGAAWFRRVGAIVTMGLGALAAALVIRHLGGAYALLLAGLLMAVGTLLLLRARRSDARYAGAA
ncbi:Uncharacterized membrane protein YoaK, UPF0700 family [Microlunatus sagamiharensis]|uniref:Uncharacterized membrane protein YoaK, UPF0700 family n=1 Tax=Microlunatus sagamiharensis TaxID=546874 RepID=A0A1H2LI35_9ACTN|nr:YoaK family protein [Microlunatus sagamiharensis]SDU80502.1 Uncharacterized membrane protein YoaK, UPF0700 family [Microlunatus sagamiharensis]